MKILLDECTPHVLKRLLTGFEVTTVQDQGWAGITNGTLLQLAEEHFDVLITSDQNLRYQQNLANRQLAILQLPTNKVPLVIRLASVVQSALDNIGVGDFVEVHIEQIEPES
jgi:predicted nuclease of predicted toxin-antitoxin system